MTDKYEALKSEIAESRGWDVATRLEQSHGGVPCVATREIRRLQAERDALAANNKELLDQRFELMERKIMTTIYVCESGCKYEGGSAFAASTSLVNAWRLMRKQMIEHSEDMRRLSIGGYVRLKGRMYWEHGSHYFEIRKFDDLKDTL